MCVYVQAVEGTVWIYSGLYDFLQSGVCSSIQEEIQQGCQLLDFLLVFAVNQKEIQNGSLAQMYSWTHTISPSSKVPK